MRKNWSNAFFILCIVVLILYVFSIKTTAAIVHISEINKNNIVVVSELGEKTRVIVPSRFDTSSLNEQSLYLVAYESNIIRRNTLKKIEKVN